MAFPIQQGLFQFVDIDHHAILGVPIGADLKEMRQRYLIVARQLHPDTCKALTKAEKERANTVLSKLVNPAWEKLSREASRLDYQVIISQIGRGLSQQQLSLTSPTAQQLLNTKKNLELEYRSLLKSLVAEQYTTLDNIYQKIALLSELNLAYLVRTQGLSTTPNHTPHIEVSKEVSKTIHKDTIIEIIEQPLENEPVKESLVAPYLRRAQNYAEKGNYAQVILEMREALKLEPNNSSCHGMLGLAYLKQNQATMAKVHITTALKCGPTDPIALQAKQELDKTLPANAKQTRPGVDSSKQSKGFWTLFGGGDKKK
ncbi:J domain-containing protein [Gloeothece verrucosa]|uniref:Heat shock protein DnaJ domain protein n=1 Tax=Gloeothece verrucosa (strain PCC 7822) TaxID=497965 RepID=E0UET8_GLOV7|nr:DnaJ domain-containing protein [Gloeothece verrucosa]ADN13068.1 heat shock protein DnaJ domain protein [Gloeothece verrucosa PCC 7822]